MRERESEEQLNIHWLECNTVASFSTNGFGGKEVTQCHNLRFCDPCDQRNKQHSQHCWKRSDQHYQQILMWIQSTTVDTTILISSK
jgi:hypothetical protein